MIRIGRSSLAAAAAVLAAGCSSLQNLPTRDEVASLEADPGSAVLVFGVSGGGGREELLRVEQVDERAAKAAGTAPLGQDYP